MRIEGKPVYVWEGIDLRASNCPTSSDETIDTATVSSPNYNFSENVKKLDTKSDAGGESTWLDENGEAEK
jgi:hypothetical protein